MAVPFIEVITCFLLSSLSLFSSSSSTGSAPSLFFSASSAKSLCWRKKSSYVNLTQWTESQSSKPHWRHAGRRISVTPDRFVRIIRRTERPLTKPLIRRVRIPPSRRVFSRSFSSSTNLNVTTLFSHQQILEILWVFLLGKKLVILLWSGSSHRQHFPVNFDGSEIQNSDGLHGDRYWIWVRVPTVDADRMYPGHNSACLLGWFIPGSTSRSGLRTERLFFLCLFATREGIILANRNLLWAYLSNKLISIMLCLTVNWDY